MALINRTGVVICSRTSSSRINKKPLQHILGKPILEHLVNRLSVNGMQVILAIPQHERDYYRFLEGRVKFFFGSEHDPLMRMSQAAFSYGLDTVVRVTHDKIFVDPNVIEDALQKFKQSKADYLYSSTLVQGAGFEIFDRKILDEAAIKYKNVEHISYAVRSLAKNVYDYRPAHNLVEPGARLLIDYPEDLNVASILLKELGDSASLDSVLKWIRRNPWVKMLNELPVLTVYTCAYNASDWIHAAMSSVASQECRGLEYICIDDASTDDTFSKICRFKTQNKIDMKILRLDQNEGLASASNIALSMAKGRYIMRLDADDFFTQTYSCKEMVSAIDGFDVVYPDNFHGDIDNIQRGSEEHHIGGAIFDRRAINHIKFTDKLRNYDGLDFWVRAKDQLKVGYHSKPTFFYRQHDGSMSKNNLEERAKTKDELLSS